MAARSKTAAMLDRTIKEPRQRGASGEGEEEFREAESQERVKAHLG